MTKKDIFEMVECGSNVAINAWEFTLTETRRLARAAVVSGAVVTVTHGNTFTPHELKTICSEGKCHVTFPDLKLGLD